MRPQGMAAGKLRWDNVRDYGLFYGFTRREIEELWYLISAMDAVVLEGSAERAEGESLTKPQLNKR